MTADLEIIGSKRIAVCAPQGALLVAERDVNDFMSEAMSLEADWLLLPVSRLGPDFLRLRTRLAGEMAQKCSTYRIGLAVVGDISEAVAASDALRDFVRESNRGTQVWFADDEAAFRKRLEDQVPA
ncbi:DUF4180 domain-containing protein [Brevundimonas sp. NIBR11]|uniref:DUF4180 domain-containing protein n=1 Tax=Brevundimonas sp. NIBR11 TaxID=3015999 RepID=UPI0022F0611B|nr:DUF4180 domain-containing protein [Brevundimonas sp. NIBR11]